uniref:Uncharacterized protein n=1 Tax=Panagrolaimus davidi TaxID=227884 RepID=A0A914Q4A6_9BILA
MDSAPPPYDDIENGNSQYSIGAAQPVVPTAPPIHYYTPDPIFQYRSVGPNSESVVPPIRQYRPAAEANSVYTVNAAAQVQRQQLGISGISTVYIIPKTAVNRAVQDAQSRRNCLCWFFAIKCVVIIVVIIIIVSTTS